MEVEAEYRRLGRPGVYHVVLYVLLCCNYVPVVVNHLAMALYGARTQYSCMEAWPGAQPITAQDPGAGPGARPITAQDPGAGPGAQPITAQDQEAWPGAQPITAQDQEAWPGAQPITAQDPGVGLGARPITAQDPGAWPGAQPITAQDPGAGPADRPIGTQHSGAWSGVYDNNGSMTGTAGNSYGYSNRTNGADGRMDYGYGNGTVREEDVCVRNTTCAQWQFHVDEGETNFITQFGLVCERGYLVNLATTLYFAGVMVGGVIFGSLSDRYGRKPFMLATLYAHVGLGVALYGVGSMGASGAGAGFWGVVALRFLLGVMMQGLQTVSYVMIMELFTPEYRCAVGTIFEVFWAGGIMWLALVGWMLRDWRNIQLLLTLPSVVTVLYVWLVPESVRWLVARHKLKEAAAIITRAAKFNRVHLDTEPFSSLSHSYSHSDSNHSNHSHSNRGDDNKKQQGCSDMEMVSLRGNGDVHSNIPGDHSNHHSNHPGDHSNHHSNHHSNNGDVPSNSPAADHNDTRMIKLASRAEGEDSDLEDSGGSTVSRHYTVCDMFRTPRLRSRSIVLFYVWMVVAVAYYGLSLSVTSLAGNKYLNLFISGAIEMPAYIGAVFILNRFGRRRPLMVYLSIGGTFCVAAGVIPTSYGGEDIWWLPTVLALCGKFGMAGCFSVILLYTCELFPTVIRNVSIGACAFWGRVGGMLAPQIMLLGSVTSRTVPVIIFGLMALSGAAATMLLPDTLDTQLPDTVQQAENLQHAHSGAHSKHLPDPGATGLQHAGAGAEAECLVPLNKDTQAGDSNGVRV